MTVIANPGKTDVHQATRMSGWALFKMFPQLTTERSPRPRKLSPGFDQDGGYGNPRVDSLAEQAASSLDTDRRRGFYAQVLSILRDDVPAIWLAQLADIYGVQTRLSWSPRR